MKLTKEMTKPLLADMKNVVKHNQMKRCFYVVVRKDELRLCLEDKLVKGEKSIIPRSVIDKYIEMLSQSIETRTLVKYTEQFPDHVIQYIMANTAKSDTKEKTVKLLKKTHAIYNDVKEIEKKFTITKPFLNIFSGTFKKLVREEISGKHVNFDMETGILSLDADNYFYKAAVKGVLYKDLIENCFSEISKDVNFSNLVIKPSKTPAQFQERLVKIAKENNIPMEKLLEVLETHLETCHKMLATYDTAANELKAVYDKIDLFDDMYNSKF